MSFLVPRYLLMPLEKESNCLSSYIEHHRVKPALGLDHRKYIVIRLVNAVAIR